MHGFGFNVHADNVQAKRGDFQGLEVVTIEQRGGKEYGLFI